MGEIIQFPGNRISNDEEKERRKNQVIFNQLEIELEELEQRLSKMADKLGTDYGNLSDYAGSEIIELQLDLAEMRRKKFYSPIQRRKILKDLTELRKISRTADELVEEYWFKAHTLFSLGNKLGIPGYE